MASTMRKQVAVPKSTAIGGHVAGLTTKTTFATAASPSLYGVVERKTPAMADGSLHGKITGLSHSNTNFDGQINT